MSSPLQGQRRLNLVDFLSKGSRFIVNDYAGRRTLASKTKLTCGLAIVVDVEVATTRSSIEVCWYVSQSKGTFQKRFGGQSPKIVLKKWVKKG